LLLWVETKNDKLINSWLEDNILEISQGFELENAIERAVVLTIGKEISAKASGQGIFLSAGEKAVQAFNQASEALSLFAEIIYWSTIGLFRRHHVKQGAFREQMYLLGYNMSVAVGVGFIALAGVAASTGVVMLIYLDHAYEDSYNKGRMNTTADLYGAIVKGAAERVRPKMMTVLAIIGGLVPIMWGSGTGSQVMRRIAAPMVGGMVTATVLTLIVIPAIYALWKGQDLKKKDR